MPSNGKSGGQETAARALRALERGATTLGIQLARSLNDRWRRMPAERLTKLAGPAANVREQALDRPDERPDVDEIEVRDLRADLTRELDRLADADIDASRGSGKWTRETNP
jgi:hypothetical protein